ncbi:MAG: 4Fe-4S binding protein [Armatimonadetes bacterium]|nr:4Fe-4S binding protein [Armatimonadota bacterium]
MTKTVRRICQIIFLAFFLVLILITAYPFEHNLATDFFVQLSPLVALGASIASRTLIWEAISFSLIIIVLSIILGRVFCGWICPLGTTLDISDVLFFQNRRKKASNSPRKIKYYILSGLFMTALFSTQAIYLLDPMCLFTRTVVLAFIAPVQMMLKWLNELGTAWSSGTFEPTIWLGTKISSFLGMRPFISNTQVYFRSSLIVFAIFATIIGLNSISRRFWCRNLCPLGALLGLFSLSPILKRKVGIKCNECSRCTTDCKMDAIPKTPRLTQATECIVCFDCVEICPQNTVSFGIRLKSERHKETALDISRRHVLQGAGIGLAFAALVKVDPARKLAINGEMPIKLSSDTLIRPPGSVAEDKFIARCVRCGMCMKACPTNGLQPAFHEAGIEGFWTPILMPRIGYCQEDCNICGSICPTNAIEPFGTAEKKHIFIGTACIDRSKCIAWYADKKCLVCDEHCSYKAIYWKVVDGNNRPFVNEKKCVGCGICEAKCPIQPSAAIRVFSYGDKRHMTRDEQKTWSEN